MTSQTRINQNHAVHLVYSLCMFTVCCFSLELFFFCHNTTNVFMLTPRVPVPVSRPHLTQQLTGHEFILPPAVGVLRWWKSRGDGRSVGSTRWSSTWQFGYVVAGQDIAHAVPNSNYAVFLDFYMFNSSDWKSHWSQYLYFLFASHLWYRHWIRFFLQQILWRVSETVVPGKWCNCCISPAGPLNLCSNKSFLSGGSQSLRGWLIWTSSSRFHEAALVWDTQRLAGRLEGPVRTGGSKVKNTSEIWLMVQKFGHMVLVLYRLYWYMWSLLKPKLFNFQQLMKWGQKWRNEAPHFVCLPQAFIRVSAWLWIGNSTSWNWDEEVAKCLVPTQFVLLPSRN